jgi:hypothetical protein
VACSLPAYSSPGYSRPRPLDKIGTPALPADEHAEDDCIELLR